MKYIFLLSGDYIDLAKEEVLSLFDIIDYEIVDRLLIVELKNINKNLLNKLSKKLALTKSIYRFLFECKIDELNNVMKKYDWNSVYKDSFCLRIHYFDDNKNNNNNKNSIKKIINKKNIKIKTYSEKKLAGYIWCSVQNPKVDLENPKTKIGLFLIDKRVYCGLLIKEIKEDFESRKSHLRPFPHPSSLHPKLARALVNISGIKENAILLDPFCGTGGFLIEAGLMDIKTIGYDINKIMINGCKENLKFFKIKNYIVKNKNALDINDKFNYIVTDLPYGLNSNAMIGYEKDWKKFRLNKKIQTKDFIKNLEKFYLKFLKNLRKKLKKGRKSVIVFPSYVNYKKLLKSSKFKIEKEFTNYVHRSLTRKIVKIS